MQRRQLYVHSLTENLHTGTADGNYFIKILQLLEATERQVSGENTKRGLNKARKKGKIGGRPKISERKQKMIKNLHQKQIYTLQEISTICKVSLASVNKYIRK